MHLKICSYFSSGFILSQPFSAHCEIIAHIVPVRRTVAKLLRNIRHALLCFAFKRWWNKLCFGLCLRSAKCIYHNKQRHRKANRQHRYYQFAVIFFCLFIMRPLNRQNLLSSLRFFRNYPVFTALSYSKLLAVNKVGRVKIICACKNVRQIFAVWIFVDRT